MASTLGEGIAREEINIIDQPVSSATGLKGVCMVVGITERGDENKPRLIRSWIEYKRYYGGLVPYSLFPMLAKRCLDNGGALYISRIVPFAYDTDTGDYLGGKALAQYTFGGWGVLLEASDAGSWGNRLRVSFVTASSGNANNIDVVVRLLDEPQYDYVVTDVPRSMDITGRETFNQRSRFVKINSNFGTFGEAVDMTLTDGYEDYVMGLSSVWPVEHYSGWPNLQNGFKAFDETFGATRFAVFEHFCNPIELQDKMIEYCADRSVMSFFAAPAFASGYETVDFRYRQGTYTSINPAPDTYVSRLVYGAITVTNPLDESKVVINLVPDLIASAARKDNLQKEWFSEAGSKRGVIKNNFGIVYNLAVPARRDEADAVDNAGITMAIKDETYGTVFWGNGTLIKSKSLLRHANVAELFLYIQRGLKPITRSELFDPNDLFTWKTIYRATVQFMDIIKNGRGIYDYKYDGDQDIDDISQAVVNTPESIDNGTYEFLLYVKPTPAMKYVGVQAVVTKNSVDLNLV